MAGVKTVEELAKEILALVMKPATEELKRSVREWLFKRNETIAALEEVIAQLHKTSKDVTISNLTGSSVGAVGGAVIIGGLIAAPLTAGASLISSAIAGGVTSGLGGATAIGSTITGLVIDKKQCEKAKECIEKDRSHLKILQTKIECYEKMYQLVIKQIEQTVDPKNGSYMPLDADAAAPRLGCNTTGVLATVLAAGCAVSASKTAASTAATTATKTATKTAAKTAAKTATKTASKGAVAGVRTSTLAVAHIFAVVGFGLDIAMVTFNAIKLRNGAKSDIGTELEKAVKELKDERDKIKKEYLEDSSDKSNDN